MDKRFFLALFLSLIAIAVSQILFPAPKQSSSSQRSGSAKDSSAVKNLASSAQPVDSLSAPRPAPAVLRSDVPGARSPAATTRLAAETTVVNTPKAIYKFRNIGAAPVSIVVRDYKNRSA